MPILEPTFRIQTANQEHAARVAQRERDHRQAFYDRPQGKEALSKAITKYCRLIAPLQMMIALEEQHINWRERLANADLWITPREYLQWNTANPAPTMQQLWQVIYHAKTKPDQRGHEHRRFYYRAAQNAIDPDDWQFCITDMNISPNVTMAKYEDMWEDFKFPGARLHQEGQPSENREDQADLQQIIDADLDNQHDLQKYGPYIAEDQDIPDDSSIYSSDLHHQARADFAAWPQAPPRD